jgi:hypothetical protein
MQAFGISFEGIRMTRKSCRRTFFNTLFIGVLCGAALSANAQDLVPAYVDPITNLRFPKKLSEIRYERVDAYPDKRLGYCVVYSARAALGQVCVYDFGHQALSPGVDSKEFKAALQIAVDGTLNSLNRAPYSKGTLIGTGTPLIEGAGKAARAEMRMFTSELNRPDQTSIQNVHLILMTSGLGKFIKFNYSAQGPTSDAFAEESRRIIEEFIRFNGATLEKLLTDVAAETAPR